MLSPKCAYLGVPCKLLPWSSLESQSMVPLKAWNHPSGSCGNPDSRTSFLVSDADVVGTPPGDDCFSFYGKAMQWSNCILHLTEFLTKIHNSTKNCAGVVVGGFLGCNHQKSKRAETTHESHLCKYHCLVQSPSSDKRWAIREAGARIDRIWVLSSTHWAGDSSAPAAGCFCHRHPFWQSPMMTIGAALASGPLRLLEILCLLHFFCLLD